MLSIYLGCEGSRKSSGLRDLKKSSVTIYAFDEVWVKQPTLMSKYCWTLETRVGQKVVKEIYISMHARLNEDWKTASPTGITR